MLWNDYREFLFLAIHDNADLKLKRSGCRGSEYYDTEGLLQRIASFAVLKYPCNVGLTFCNGPDKLDYYKPNRNQVADWKKKLLNIWDSDKKLSVYECDVPNVGTFSGGFSSAPDFYYDKRNGKTQFEYVAESQINEVNEYEKKVGFLQIGENRLYQN